ncbi:HDIG domain-containing metalloprotein [Clostridium sp. BSD9I1]|uniref:HDIG domain-containing metalloprotein n=1 Tax=Clostridium sp. BSD9I1 TaxID=2003589 RepID=UPI001FA8D493|nr:HDIG domain-containing metalloprotein [Clostridium sp. BSD9I1]
MTTHEIFLEITKHLMEDEKPSIYLNELAKREVFNEYPFKLLKAMIKTEQSPTHHPEGSVWNHTMMVVDAAAKEKSLSEHPKVFMWGALLHDIGKPPTTKLRKGRLTSYDHDKEGKKLAEEFLRCFTNDEDFIEKVVAFVRWHMQPLFVAKNLPFADIDKMSEEIDLDEIALLSLCDRLGRGEMTEEKIEKEKNHVEEFRHKVEEKLAKACK